jgi:hypothetical protein
MFIVVKVEVFNIEDDLKANYFKGYNIIIWEYELIK